MPIAQDNGMYSPPYPLQTLTAKRLNTRRRMNGIVTAGTLVIGTLLCSLLLWVLPGSFANLSVAVVVVPAMLVWIWRQPARGIYVLFAAAVMQESVGAADIYVDDIGR